MTLLYFLPPMRRRATANGRRQLLFLAQAVAASVALAVLQLSATLYALALYEEVLPARSLSALAGLTAILGALVVAIVALDALRARALCDAGLALVDALAGELARHSGPGTQMSGQNAADIERLLRFVVGHAPGALLDAISVPACLLALAWLHPGLALFGLASAALLVATAIHVEATARADAELAAQAYRARLEAAAADIGRRSRRESATRAMTVLAVGRGLRMGLQSLGLALAALLVMEELLRTGELIVASILMARLFATVDAAAGQWRTLSVASLSYGRIVRAISARAGGA